MCRLGREKLSLTALKSNYCFMRNNLPLSVGSIIRKKNYGRSYFLSTLFISQQVEKFKFMATFILAVLSVICISKMESFGAQFYPLRPCTCITNYAKRLPCRGARAGRHRPSAGRSAQAARPLSRSFLTRSKITTSICITMLVTPYSLPATFAGAATVSHRTWNFLSHKIGAGNFYPH